MLDIIYTFGQLGMVLLLAYGAFLIARSGRTFGQALELSVLARSNPYAAIRFEQVERSEPPTKGRPSGGQGPRMAGGLNGWSGAAA